MTLDIIAVPPQPTPPPQKLLVGLHGWGGNAKELEAVVPALDLPGFQYLFPNAPFPHPRVLGGFMWYDFDEQRDQKAHTSAGLLSSWLNSLPEHTGVALEQTILCGFSQGGAMALEVGLTLPLAGIIVLSGYLHPIQRSPESAPPVLIVHGTQDAVVPLAAAHHTRDTLTSLGITVLYQEFPMEHEIRPEVLALIQSFVTKQAPILSSQ